MDERAAKLLEAFAQACPVGPLRDEDWHRLYAFTLYVHQHHLHAHPRTVRDYLLARRCSLQKASWVSTEYKHFSELLALYDQQRSHKI